MISLTGKRVLVTGASSGIGAECARLCAGLGAGVVALSRRSEALTALLEELPGEGHTALALDLTDLAGIEPALAALTGASGPLDGIVHCAGITSHVPLRVDSAERFRAVQLLNVDAAYALVRAYRKKAFPGGRGGSVVLMSSVSGLVGSAAMHAYCASKAALIGMARSLALELAKDRVRVNCVAPGLVETPMSETSTMSLPAPALEALKSAHPLGVGKPKDVANAVAFLLSDAASWITGTTVVVDGGYTAH